MGEYEIGCEEVEEEGEDGRKEEGLNRRIISLASRGMVKAFPPSTSWNFLHSCWEAEWALFETNIQLDVSGSRRSLHRRIQNIIEVGRDDRLNYSQICNKAGT